MINGFGVPPFEYTVISIFFADAHDTRLFIYERRHGICAALAGLLVRKQAFDDEFTGGVDVSTHNCRSAIMLIAQQGIDDSMGEYVGVRVSLEPQLRRDFHTAQDQLSSRGQTVNVKTRSYAWRQHSLKPQVLPFLFNSN